MKKGKAYACTDCGEYRPHYAHGRCNTCYRKAKGYDKPPHWLRNCQRCGQQWSKMTHKAFGLCSMCYRLAGDQAGRLDYWQAQFEINRPGRLDRLLTPENLTALKLARIMGASEAARALDVDVQSFRMWCANRESVPARHRKRVLSLYRKAWKNERRRDGLE